MSSKPVAFIDADILLHRAVSFIDSEFDGEPVNDWKTALHYFNKLQDKWLKEVGKTEDYFLVLSVGKNFRADLYDEYKGNRKDIVPHPALHDLKQEVMEYQAAIWEPNLEADDLIGIHASSDPKHHLAVSADKDFATVPCRLMIPTSHGRKKPIWSTFSEKEADRNWMIQTLTGDTIDNYPGLPQVGPKKAADIVDDPHTLIQKSELYKRGPKKGTPKPPTWEKGEKCSVWQSMVSNAEAKGMSESELLVMARLARILRHGDYDFDKKEITLWTP